MKTAILKLKDINPAPYNPRKKLKKGDKTYEALSNSLERFGMVEPMVVNTRTGNLVGGHQRLTVLLDQGAEETECVIVDLSLDDEKLLNIALNKIEGQWDYDKLEALFSEFTDEDIKFTGFDEDELMNLFGDDLPDFDNEEEPEEAKKEEKSREGEPEEPEKPAVLKEFNIFLSFPSKELAEAWLKKKGIGLEYEGTAHNITIRMEGLDYGKGD